MGRIHFLHHSPGRIRVEVVGLKANHSLSEAIHSLAGKVDGIEQVRASTVTGSVLVHYDKTDPLILQRLLAMVEEAEAWLASRSNEPDAFPRRAGSIGAHGPVR